MTTSDKLKVGHDELMHLLADHLRQRTDRMVWTDMQLGPVWSARPDVWTLNKSYSKPMPLSYECKVSRSDFMHDVTAGKWQSYLAYSCAVIFAVPAGLIAKDELPKGCGLMTWNGVDWRTVKGPTLNVCPPLPQDLMLKLLMDGIERAAAAYRDRLRGQWVAEQAVTKKFGRKVAEVVADELSLDQRIAWVRESYEKARQEEEERNRLSQEARRREADAAWSRICSVLSLTETATDWTVERAIDELAEAVSKDREVAKLTMQIRRIQEAIEDAGKTPNHKIRNRKRPAA